MSLFRNVVSIVCMHVYSNVCIDIYIYTHMQAWMFICTILCDNLFLTLFVFVFRTPFYPNMAALP